MRVYAGNERTGDRNNLRVVGGGLLSPSVSDADGEATLTLGIGPGQSLYVSADDGSDSNDGSSWDAAFATIQEAVDNAVSERGDVIYVKPGTYAENVVVSQKDYLTVIGVSLNGYGRPDVVPASGLALLADRSQGFVASNIRFASDGQDSDVARIEGNGWKLLDCVLDGATGMAATKALLRLWCDAADDSYTASEGVAANCLFRGSPGFGIAADVQNAAVGVGPTHCVVEDCRFVSNVKEDLIALETAPGTYTMQDWLVARCYFGMGTGKNKATHVDIQTNNGATNTGNVFAGCFFFDDTINTTAIKAASTGSGFIGCFGLDGVIDGDALD